MSASSDLPTGWSTATLPELVGPGGLFVDGDWVESKDQDPDGDVRLIQLADVGDGRYVDKSSRFLTSAKAADLRCTFLGSGDVLIARMPDPLGRACIFPGDRRRSVTVVDVCVVRAGDVAVNHRWLMWTINAPQVRALVAQEQRGSTRKRIARSSLGELRLPVPPRPEQDRIVAAIEQHLSDIDAGVAALRRVQANLKRNRASVLKAACEGRLVPTEAELARKDGRSYEGGAELLKRILTERHARWEAAELAKMKAKGQVPAGDAWKKKYEEPKAPATSGLGELPEGWCWTSVHVAGDVLLGRQRAPQYLTGAWFRPYLRVANVKDDRLDFGDVEQMDFEPAHFEKYKLEEGDILVSEGQSLDRVGESAIYRGGVDGLCFQKTLHRFRPAQPGPTAEFAQVVFRSHVKTGFFGRLASITTNIAHLTLEKFETAPFPLPPRAEQERIVAEVARLMSVADAVEQTVRQQLARAARLRQAVLKCAFEGKLVPQDPREEPASVMLERLRGTAQAAPAAPRAKRGGRSATSAET